MLIQYDALRNAISNAPRAAWEPLPDYELDSVCLLLFDRGETMLLTIQKTDSDGYHWRDQIALPGGRIEEEDLCATAAALRELHEELGIEPGEVEVLGSIGHFQTASLTNDLEVIVGRWLQPSQLRVDEREVARVLELSLAELMELHHAGSRTALAPGPAGDEFEYAIANVRIWGVTARILHDFLNMLPAPSKGG
ncbi:MAG: CoA pyrophosphatase [Phycisphaerales bacterium]|nr:MAG: CoA pyrophosphatase [Phycisphaerales bacterium]